MSALDTRVLSSLDELSPERLTGLLRDGGHLPGGRVSRIEALPSASTHGHNARLHVSYSPDAPATAPERLFLKLCAGPTPFGDSEIRTYTAISPALAASPFPACYHAAHDPVTGSYHLLLADLGESHRVCWELEPDLAWAGPAVDALAELHAGLWDHPRLNDLVGPDPDELSIRAALKPAAQGFAAMLHESEALLSSADRKLIASLFAALPAAMLERAEDHAHLSCVHGDPNPGNLLVANQKNPSGETRAWLIDRQLFDWNLARWTGASDLALMMVPWWEPERRQALEGPLLSCYHARLNQAGIPPFSRDQLWRDYRLGVVQCLALPAARCANARSRQDMRWLWVPQLQRILSACKDLDCLNQAFEGGF